MGMTNHPDHRVPCSECRTNLTINVVCRECYDKNYPATRALIAMLHPNGYPEGD